MSPVAPERVECPRCRTLLPTFVGAEACLVCALAEADKAGTCRCGDGHLRARKYFDSYWCARCQRLRAAE